MRKSLLWLFVFFILLTTYNPKSGDQKKFKFDIKKIEINSNYLILEEEELKKKLSFLYEKNLFSLDIDQIQKNLTNEQFIDSFTIKKVYPSTLVINIVEKKLLAILIEKKSKFYITEKGEIIEFYDIKNYEKIPTVFRGGEKFIYLYNELVNIKFPTEKIKSYYYFDSGRWDLILQDEITIKLPINDYKYSLENFLSSYLDMNFKNYKIFDYRIKNQLILN